ncbi:PML-RARA-regulated adapter molecule 1 [Lonchura striata]|uniref:PML-RARA-regulated adapter molecule 1 n=1 Tax=Lonchura striata TaxID=40157 RepID=A0A218USJ7_9PASE|nr:PML-RARA-regulated adapter molecule 1 isoform X2 [Lonchura striata domestica]OWK56312.1 PML-RARA-regulated adapter molecule 1 [Lonchura striata domestica]
MMHLEGRDAVVRHLRAKFQQNRKEPPNVCGWPESHPAASHGPEPGQTVSASKGDPLQEAPWSRRDCTRPSPPHSTGQSMGQHPPHSACETPARMVCRKKETAPGANFHPVPAKPGDVLNKKVEASSDPPHRKPAHQTWPPAKDKGAPVVLAKGAAAAAPLLAVGSPQRTEHPALPRRKPLPPVRALGVKPGKPRRPPDVDLAKFRAAAHPGKSICPATEPPRSAQLGHPQPGCAASVPAWFPLQDAPSGTGDEDELYDDVEPVELARRCPGLLLPSVSQLAVYPCPRGGGNAGQASNRVTLLATTLRESQISQKMKNMTLKACKKEEKMDREFQKKFKFKGSINVLTQMMVDPAATEKRGGAKNLPLRRGEILDVIQFTNQEQILCRNSQRRYGYVPRAVMLPLLS